jgi:hypothetical protein
MAFIAEDGSGLTNANSYIDLVFATAYHTDLNHVSWNNLSSADQEFSCTAASFYIDKRFGRRFRGTRVRKTQALQWPRISAYDNDGFVLSQIPLDLRRATAEYALRVALYKELAPDPVLSVPQQDFSGSDLPTVATEQSEGLISSKTDVVFGAVEESVSYRSPGSQSGLDTGKNSQSSLVTTSNIPEYPAADLWIENLLRTRSHIINRG